MILKQVTTTKPVENWHRVLKDKATGGKAAMAQYSLTGTCRLVLEVDTRFDTLAEQAAFDWDHKQLPIRERYPGIQRLPFPVQKLVTEQLDLAETKIDEGDDIDAKDIKHVNEDMTCGCGWFKKYQLPCRHILEHDVLYGLLTDKHWEQYAHMFDESTNAYQSTTLRRSFRRRLMLLRGLCSAFEKRMRYYGLPSINTGSASRRSTLASQRYGTSL